MDGRYVHIGRLLAGGFEDGEAAIRGWIYRTRSSGKLCFVTVRDSTGVLQVTVARGSVPDADFEGAKRALIESSVQCSGTVVKDERAPGGFELRAASFTVLGGSDNFPITEYRSEEHLLNYRHLWIRSQELTRIMKVKSSALAAAREWFSQNDFYEVTPPIITSNSCEGGSTLFELKYFGERAYLSQSAQLYLEAMMYSLERVFALTPSFRAEKSRTTRHLAEYWHLEGEEAFVGNQENMTLQEELVSAMVTGAARRNPEELRALGRDPSELLGMVPPFKRLSYGEAVKRLRDRGAAFEWGMDPGTNEERLLVEGEEKPVFIYNYPKEIKAFYMRENPDDPRTYLCADLLGPEGYGEIIGGSERETDGDRLVERLKAQGSPLEPYQWYLDLRRFGSVQHSGFGLGIERLLRWVCKQEHIRDTIPFPRTINRVYP
ncbi:MAG: asparagine--tRNA ligase [Euryarchaeota archaeon]|nr:asparagine--tRNA ligase [Euryarchaeota archaeon]